MAERPLQADHAQRHKPPAKPFQDWVTKVVLPAVRKDGLYVKGEEKVVSGEMSGDDLSVSFMRRTCKRLPPTRTCVEAPEDTTVMH